MDGWGDFSSVDNLVTSQHIDYNSPQVTTTQEGVETVIHKPPQDLHPATNALADIFDTSTTITPSISVTKTLTSVISEHIPLLPDYYLDIIMSMLQQLRVKL